MKKLPPAVTDGINRGVKKAARSLENDLASAAKDATDPLARALLGGLSGFVSTFAGEETAPKPPTADAPRQKIKVVVDGKVTWGEVIPHDDQE